MMIGLYNIVSSNSVCSRKKCYPIFFCHEPLNFERPREEWGIAAACLMLKPQRNPKFFCVVSSSQQEL